MKMNRQHKYSLDSNTLREISQRFPKCELSYEQLSHTKVQSDIYSAIPMGKKQFIWFTYYKSECVCFLLSIDRNRNILAAEKVTTQFSSDLALGTILYGTSLRYDGCSFFSVEDVCYFEGKQVTRKNSDIFSTLSYIFNEKVGNSLLSKQHIVLQVPVMSKSRTELFEMIDNLPYSVYCIQHVQLNHNKRANEVLRQNTEPKMPTAVFRVQADITNDIYSLHCYVNDTSHTYYDKACIPNYKTSVYMNSLFRNIKENRNLDSLEESDDEEEFENVALDKFVNLDKCEHMECKYNARFKKWIPTKIVKYGKVATPKMIGELIRNTYVKSDRYSRRY